MHSNHQISFESRPDGKGFTKKLMEYLNITYVMLWAICCHLNKSKNVKNSHGEELLLVKLQASAYNFNKNITPPSVFSRFLSCANVTKFNKASHIDRVICRTNLDERIKSKTIPLVWIVSPNIVSLESFRCCCCCCCCFELAWSVTYDYGNLRILESVIKV